MPIHNLLAVTVFGIFGIYKCHSDIPTEYIWKVLLLYVIYEGIKSIYISKRGPTK